MNPSIFRMKDSLYNLFVWLSGSNKKILEDCSRNEHKKHAMYGGLIVVPAILGFFSMSYAISTVSGGVLNTFAIFGAGLLWASIVFLIDRFLVATFKKGDSVKSDIISISFFARLIFAVGIGFLVSHPLLLFVFREKISERINEIAILKEDEINSKYDSLASIQEIKKVSINDDVELFKNYRDELAGLLADEVAGTVKGRKTTGIYGEGPAAKVKRQNLIQADREYQRERSESITLIAKIDTAIVKLNDRRNEQLSTIFVANDYLNRTDALGYLSDNSDTIKNTVWFLIVFFVFVDILPVTLKASTPKGEYDEKIAVPINSSNLYSLHALRRDEKKKLQKVSIEEIAAKAKSKIQKIISDWDGENIADLVKILEEYISHPSFEDEDRKSAVEKAKTFGQQVWNMMTENFQKSVLFVIFAFVQGLLIFGLIFQQDLQYISLGTAILFVLCFIIDKAIKALLKLE